MISTYKLFGLPYEIGITLIIISIAILLAPYFPGSDFGAIKIPKLRGRQQIFCKKIGPILVSLSILAFYPIWKNNQEEWSMSVGINNSLKQSFWPWRQNEWRLSYVMENKDGELHVTPHLNYLNKFNDEELLESFKGIFNAEKQPFPILDIKVVNNTSKSIFISEAIFDIQWSKVDPTPLLSIYHHQRGRHYRQFYIRNDGWGRAQDVKVHFRLFPTVYKPTLQESPESYPNVVIIGDIEESKYVSVEDALKKEGVNIEGLKSLKVAGMLSRGGEDDIITLVDETDKKYTMLRKELERELAAARGPFADGEALLQGELIFKCLNSAGDQVQKRLKFDTVIRLYAQLGALAGGGHVEQSFEYNTKFDFSGKYYKSRTSISQALKPGDSDRFTITVGVERSSLHKFRLELITNNGDSIKSRPILLHAIVPRRLSDRIFHGKHSY